MSRRSFGFIAAVAISLPATALAGGFEVGTNTALANARGGTGVVSKSDPSAATFNPGRLAFARGMQVLLGSNVVDLNVRFQRDPLQRPNELVEFDEVSNVAPPFPVPYLAASWDLGVENLTVGLSASGPHAYGRRCTSELIDGECVVDPTNAARHMIVETNIIEVFFLASASYAFDLGGGKLGLGISGGPAWQKAGLALVVDKVYGSTVAPFTENPDFQAPFRGSNLQDIKPVVIGGLAWEGDDGLRLGVSYQSGLSWEAEGQIELELPAAVSGFTELTDDGLVLRTKQAHRLAVGWGHAHGEHPGVEGAPLFDVEMNVVWEDWSRVDTFEVEPLGSLSVSGVQELEIHPVLQPKGYQDTFALRLGTTVGVLPWLSGHAGAFFETAAQPLGYTNFDFVSWERYSGSAGFTVHASDVLDVTASYAYIGSGKRTVRSGQVYSQIPLSQCTYPNYDHATCDPPGTPPGNPQNEGEWHAHFHVAGLNVTGKF